jgi:LuxR family maltose regulon positive regulatory protein
MAGEEITQPILSTKLHRPPVVMNHVHRPHLLDRLNQYRQRPLTLVSAPAGYGKSVLISCWLEDCKDPVGWISLDKSDNDLRRFTTYLIAAVEKLYPGSCLHTQAQLNAVHLPSIKVLSKSLLNELDRIDQPFILVLDDYYLIKETAVHNLIAEILKHPPPSLHLVIVGRHDPPFPIATLRAQSKMTEIRTKDLRFTLAETEMFLNQLLGIEIDPSTATALEVKTEGWVTGLRLAALSMREQIGIIDSSLLEPDVDAQYVMEYLFAEVFSRQPPEISQYLLRTAILGRFCGPLCEAVCAPAVDASTRAFGGWNFIAYLKKENLFLIPLDAENRWFRFHHLFQKLLVNQLKHHCSPEEINALHARASAWFAEDGLIEEALDHALAAGETAIAIKLVARHGHQLMNDQQWPRLERWLDMLPRDRVEENPEMLLLRLWSNHMRTAGLDVAALATQLEKIEYLISILPPSDSVKRDQIRSHCDALRSFQYFVGADGKSALKHALLACKNIPIQHKRALLRAHIFQVGSYQMIGELETGLSLYYKEVQENPNLNKNDQAMYLANLCFVYWVDADLISMLQTSENTLKIAMDHRIPEAIAFSLYFNGIACYHRNNLQSAEEKLTRMIKDFYMYMQLVHTHGSFCLSLIYQAQGQPDKARERNRKIMEYAVETGNQRMLQTAQAFEAELALRQGHFSESSSWAKRFNPEPFLPPFAFYMPQLTLVKILLAQDTTDSRRRAADLLDRLNDFLASIHYNNFLIEALALQALLYDSQGERSAALETLTHALQLAEPGGFIRPFVDLGPTMAELLKLLLEERIAVDYIKRILTAFEQECEQTVVQEAADRISRPHQPLVVPLTNRELDVLELLAQRLSNKEIAEKLFISVSTIKGHLQNIFGKLNAGSRREAVEKAKKMGLL